MSPPKVVDQFYRMFLIPHIHPYLHQLIYNSRAAVSRKCCLRGFLEGKELLYVGSSKARTCFPEDVLIPSAPQGGGGFDPEKGSSLSLCSN